MAATYRDVLDLFDAQKGTNGYQSLPEFAQSLNEMTGSQNFDAGLKDSVIKRASIGLDRAIESTGAPDALADFFGTIGSAVGFENAGREAGRALPRGVVNFLPALAAAPFTGGGSVAAGLLGAGSTAASAGLIGADTYTQTGSPTAALLSAAALPVAGIAARAGGQLALKAIGAPLIEGIATETVPALGVAAGEAVSQRVAETGAQRVANYLGGQVAALGTFEAANEVSSVAQGQGLYNPVTPERLFSQMIGQLPFAALDIKRVVEKTPRAAELQKFLTTESKNEASKSVTDLPPVVRTEVDTDALKVVEGIKETIKKAKEVKANAELSPEEVARQVAELTGGLDEVVKKAPQGLGYGDWMTQQAEVYRQVERAPVVADDATVKLATDQAIAVKDVAPPTEITEALTQVDDLVKASVDIGTPPVDEISLRDNLTVQEEIGTDEAVTPVKAVVAERAKVSRSASLKAATLASQAAKNKKYENNLMAFATKEEIGRAKPKSQEAEDVAQVQVFLKRNQENIGEGRESENLGRAVINVYSNWVEQGRPDDYAGLQSRMGKAAQNLRREGTKNRPTLKEDGSVSSDANVSTKRFATQEEAQKFATEGGFAAEPKLRKNKTSEWYVLEQTEKAAKLTSLETETGQVKSNVELAAHIIDPDASGQFFSQMEGETVANEVAPLVQQVNSFESTSATMGDKVVLHDFSTAIRQLDHETIAAELSDNGLRPTEVTELGTREIISETETSQIRNRMAAVFDLQTQYGKKAILDKSSLRQLNKNLSQADRFASHEDVLNFNRDPATQNLLLEASRALYLSGKAQPGLTKPDGEYVGIEESDITPYQREVYKTYGLDSGNLVRPLEAVAQNDQGVLGGIARELLSKFKNEAAGTKLVNEVVQNGTRLRNAEFNQELNRLLIGRDALPSEFVPTDIAWLHHIIVHEFAHRITSEKLDLPENLAERTNIETLRQKAIEGLPKEIRQVFDTAVADSRYEKYVQNRSTEVFDLKPEQYKWRSVLYGLYNAKEFLAQSFSDLGTQQYLSKINSGGKKNVFKSFLGIVKKVLGLNVDDNLLAEVFSSTDRLLNSKLRKPYESDSLISGMLGRFGLDTKEVAERTPVVKSMLDVIRTSTEGSVKDGALGKGLSSLMTEAFLSGHAEGKLDVETTQKLNRAQSWFDNLQDGDQALVGSLFEKEGQPIRTVGDILRNSSEVFADPKARAEFLDNLEFVDKPILDALGALRRYVTVTAQTTSNIHQLAAKGLVNEAFEAPGIGENNKIYGATQEILKVEKQLQRAARDVQQLNNINPVGFRTLQLAGQLGESNNLPAPPKNLDVVSDVQETMGLKKPGILARAFMPAAQLAEKYPVIREAIYSVFSHQGDVRQATRTALFPFGVEKTASGEYVPSKAKLQDAYSVAQSPELNKAVSDIRRLMNKKKSADLKDGDIQKLTENLSPVNRAKVLDVVNQMTQSMKLTQETILTEQRTQGEVLLATVIQQRNPSFRSNQSANLAKTLNEGLRMLNDPAQVPVAQQILASVQGRLAPEVFQEAVKFAVEDQARVNDLAGFYSKRDWFSTEQRTRRFLLRMVDGEGATYTADYATETQAAAAKRRLTDEGYKFADLIDRKGNDQHPSYSQDAMTDEIARINKTRIAQLQSQVSPEVFERLSGFLDIETDLRRAGIAKDLINKGSDQRLQPGREELDMIANHVNYINRTINGQVSKSTKAKMELALLDPEVQAQPELSALARSHIDNYMYKDSQVGQALTQANFLYYLGMNLSSGMMELGQSAFSLVPTLVNEGASTGGAYRGIVKTAKSISKWAIKGAKDTDWDNPEHSLVMQRSGARGDIGLNHFSEVLDDNAQTSIGLSQMANLQEQSKVGALAKKPLAMLENIATGLYAKFTHFNSRMALLTAFDHFRSKGLDFDSAFAEAERINNVSNFAGGRAARAIGLYSNRTQAGRTASMAVGSLQSYTLGMMSMMGRYISRGYGADSKGLTPTERSNARRATVIMLGTQLAAAGALGLPGVGAGIAVLEQMFPDLELNKAIRENLAKLGGDDTELGAFISDIALRGVVNQLGPVDIGSRFSMGNSILGASSYDGFDVKNILGPTYNLFSNMALGVQQAASGNTQGAVHNLVPPAFKKIVDLYSADGDIRDGKGNLLLKPTFGEQFALAVGFRPKRVSDIQDAKRIESRSQEIEKRETMQFNNQLADALEAKDQGTLKTLLQQKAAQDDTFDPRSAIRAASVIVENRTMPVDLSRTVRSEGAGSLLQSFQIGSQGPSEVQRLQLRKSLEASTGIPGLGTMSPRDVMTAQQVDLLTKQGMTREQAKEKVSKQFASPVPSLF